MTTALILIDVQRGFDSAYFGKRNNPDAEANIAALARAWQGPIVLVRHDSVEPGSPLAPDSPGNALKPEVADVRPDLLVTKSVHSSFHGEVDLHGWLTRRGITDLVLAGVQTNACVETTARVGNNLGYRVRVVLDATFTFDVGGLTADQLTEATAANLEGLGFAKIVKTAELLA